MTLQAETPRRVVVVRRPNGDAAPSLGASAKTIDLARLSPEMQKEATSPILARVGTPQFVTFWCPRCKKVDRFQRSWPDCWRGDVPICDGCSQPALTVVSDKVQNLKTLWELYPNAKPGIDSNRKATTMATKTTTERKPKIAGRTTGLGVDATAIVLFKRGASAGWDLSRMAKELNSEFPGRKKKDEGYMRMMARQYNEGTLNTQESKPGKQYPVPPRANASENGNGHKAAGKKVIVKTAGGKRVIIRRK